jgi:ribonuclease HII
MPDLLHERSVLAGLGPAAVVVGLDEVGRGALAGPVCVGALALRAADLDETVRPVPTGLDDSKALTARRREALVGPVGEWAAGTAVGSATAAEIDGFGIVGALRLAALRALEELVDQGLRADVALLDGVHDWLSAPPARAVPAGPGVPAPFAEAALPRRVVTVVKGDRACATIAGASVLAKVRRDAGMTGIAAEHPAFAWERNKGYGSAAHREALERLGPSDHHRRSWRLTRSAPAPGPAAGQATLPLQG